MCTQYIYIYVYFMGLGKGLTPVNFNQLLFFFFEGNFNQLLKLIKLSDYENVQLNCFENNHYAKTKFHVVEK